MNQSLARIHLGLAIFGLLHVLHALALKGVRQGRAWGCTLSRVRGVLLLFAIPLGTIKGAFVLMRTGKTDWQHAAL